MRNQLDINGEVIFATNDLTKHVKVNGNSVSSASTTSELSTLIERDSEATEFCS